MIKVLLIEDEMLAAKRLKKLLAELTHEVHVVNHCDSIESSIAYLNTKPDIDIMLMDIKLGDGLSLDILQKVDIKTPIIFTTAYDEYTLKAFKLNSIDYLLKPIDVEELSAALDKFQLYHKNEVSMPDVANIIASIKGHQYKERYLIKQGQQMVIVTSSDIAYFYTEDGYTHLITHDHKKYILDDTLDALQNEINPAQYYRINRSMIVKVESIAKIEQYFNSRFSLQLIPPFKGEVIVSRDRVKEFREWVGG